MAIKKPLFVAISDVHFTPATLEVASQAFKMAIDKASELRIPLVDCGDVTDTKAILRGEVVNRLIELVKYAKTKEVKIYFLVGNHSLMNEKSTEHTLHFLNLMENADVIDSTRAIGVTTFIPYQNAVGGFLREAKHFGSSIVLGHQGTIGGQLGHYVRDSSSFDPRHLPDLKKVFLGHYHSAYELHNTVSIGNPYTLSFGEANDHPKGYIVIYDDGSYDRIPTNLRKHVIIDHDVDTEQDLESKLYSVKKEDFLWLKLRGHKRELAKSYYDKSHLLKLTSVEGFKFDKIVKDKEVLRKVSDSLPVQDQLDQLIGDKPEIRSLWRKLINEDKAV